jgi:uncharacterized damage-inducible protein DinB
MRMPVEEESLATAVARAWTTNHRVMVYLVEKLPEALWKAPPLPGQKRTIRAIAAHVHNSRSGWIRTLGSEFGIAAPAKVDEKRVARKALVAALGRSHRAMLRLLELGADNGGRLPPARAYVWRNLPLDLGHVLAYFVAHEGHHRGQILILARALGHPLPREVMGGLWQWSRLSAAPRASRTGGRRRQ